MIANAANKTMSALIVHDAVALRHLREELAAQLAAFSNQPLRAPSCMSNSRGSISPLNMPSIASKMRFTATLTGLLISMAIASISAILSMDERAINFFESSTNKQPVASAFSTWALSHDLNFRKCGTVVESLDRRF